MPEGAENQVVGRAMRILLERTARTAGADLFKAMARAIAEALGTRYGLVSELVDPAAQTIRTLAVWNGEGYSDNFEYSLRGTPCANVVAGEACHYPCGVATRFPDDTMLGTMGIQSYLGLPIGRETPVLGIVVAMHDKPTAPTPELEAVLHLFADRAAVELERMRFEADLRRSEARYRQIVSTCIEGVWMIDANATTTFVNHQMAAMLGYTETEMLGRSLYDFTDASGRALAEAGIARRAIGVAEHHEFRFVHREGRDVWTVVAANPLVDDAGVYTGALALVTDVTEKRRLSAAAARTQKLESLGVLAGGVAHDFNNLLVGILGNAELALRESPTPRSVLLDIRSSALAAAGLTRQLLAFAGKGTFVMATVELNALIAEMPMLLSAAVSKKTALRFVPTSDLSMVEADAGQLNQVVMNLIINASEALGERPGTVTVTTSIVNADRDYLDRLFLDASLEPGEYVRLEVADDGCGMDAATKAKIFDPFFTTKFAGRGLGLAALLGVLRSHRGAVCVDSEVGTGTTFTVLLPRASSVHAAPPSAPSRDEPLTGRVILVADDEPAIRTLLSHLLQAEGATVLLAVDGLDALATFRAHASEIDLALLDLTMPGLSGEEVFRELRVARPDLNILLTSGHADDDIAARLGGPTGFLPKPWTTPALFAEIRRALER